MPSQTITGQEMDLNNKVWPFFVLFVLSSFFTSTSSCLSLSLFLFLVFCIIKNISLTLTSSSSLLTHICSRYIHTQISYAMEVPELDKREQQLRIKHAELELNHAEFELRRGEHELYRGEQAKAQLKKDMCLKNTLIIGAGISFGFLALNYLWTGTSSVARARVKTFIRRSTGSSVKRTSSVPLRTFGSNSQRAAELTMSSLHPVVIVGPSGVGKHYSSMSAELN
jgi:hypothetical protein